MDLNHPTSAYLADNRSQQLVKLIIAFGILKTIFLALFIWARAFARTLNGVDFWLIPPAYLGCFSHVINGAVLVKYAGAGRHFITATPDNFKVLLKIFQSVTIGIKLFLATGDLIGAYRWASLPNLITDIIMLILSLPLVWKLHIGTSQKVGLSLTFLTGSIGIVTSAIHFATFFTRKFFSDPTWDVVPNHMWICVEPGAYFIAAVLPSLRPLIAHLLKNFNIRYSRYMHSRNHGRLIPLNREINEVSMAGVEKDRADSATNSDNRSTFSKINNIEASVTTTEGSV
ncbi:MAG: hypothetical protein Q9191_008000 [Dirinaria sp. TL-2023a]